MLLRSLRTLSLMVLLVLSMGALQAEDAPAPAGYASEDCANNPTCDCCEDETAPVLPDPHCPEPAGSGGAGAGAGAAGAGGGGGGGGGAGAGTASASILNTLQRSHIHGAVDYAVRTAPAVGSGCAPCGAGGGGLGDMADVNPLPGLQVTRYLRDRNNNYAGSLGKYGFLAFDRQIWLSPWLDAPAGQEQMWFGYFRPNLATFNVAGVDATAGDGGDGLINGNLHSPIGIIRELHMLDAQGVLTPDISQVVSMVAIRANGEREIYEAIQVNSQATQRSGRLLRLENRDGTPTVTLTYRYPANATLEQLGNQRVRLWIYDTVSDAYGNTVTCTWDETTKRGTRYPLTGMTLPNGQTISYVYTGSYLTGVSHPDGSASSFTRSYDATLQKTVQIIDDPAAGQTDRHKTVYTTGTSWVDPVTQATRSQPVGQCSRIDDGTGAMRYLSWDVVAGTRITWLSDAGVQEHVSTNTWSSVAQARRAMAYDLNADPATWTWESTAWTSGTTSRAFRVPSRTDELGRTTLYEQTTAGRAVTNVTHPDGSSVATTCNAVDQPLTETDELGRVTAHTYDSQYRRISTTVAAGTPDAATRQWTYNARGQVTSATDARGHVTDYAYDAAGRLITKTEPADQVGGVRAVWQYAYDATGNLWRITDPAGRQALFAYDSRSRLITTTYADGSTETVTYGTGTHANLVVARTDRNGRQTTFAYDAAGCLITQVTAAGTAVAVSTTTTYLPGSTLVATVTSAGEQRSIGYDHRLRPASRTVLPRVGMPLTSTTSYDDAGQRLAETDPYGRSTRFLYDLRGRIIRTVRELIPGSVPAGTDLAALPRLTTTNPSYTIEDAAYDLASQVLSRTSANGVVTTYAYDGQGRLSSQTEDAGSTPATTAYSYDAAGNRLTVTSPRGVVTRTTYTDRNLPWQSTEADGSGAATVVSTTTYSGTRKPLSVADALGRITTYTYGTCCDRLAGVTDPAGYITTFTYDFVGNRTQMRDGNGLLTITTYDARNRPHQVTNAANETTTYTYDDDLTDDVGLDAAPAVAAVLPGLGMGAGADGAAVAVTDPAGAVSYELHDGLGRTVARIDALGHAMRVAYDAIVGGLVETVQIDALDHVTRTRADGAGRIRQQVDALGNVSTVGYDAVGNQLSQRDALGVGWDAAYDARNRLLSRSDTRTPAGTTMWTYDLDGNRLAETDATGSTETSVYDLRNRRIQLTDRVGGVTTFGYDPVGNLTQISDADNAAHGGLANLAGTTQYAYDARSLLIAEAFPTGQAGRTLRMYAYDAGRRLSSRQIGVLHGAFSATPAFAGTPAITGYAYDAANRLVTRTYPDSANDTFAYDLAARLTSAASARYAATVTRAYDVAGRLTSEALTLPDGTLAGTVVGPATYTVGYAYSADNQLTGLTYPTGTQVTRSSSARHELAGVQVDGSPVATRVYDAGGRLTSTTLGNGLVETRSYVAGSSLVQGIAVPGVTGFGYTYDLDQRKLSEADNLDATRSQSFGYDAAGRLTMWTAGPTQTQSWTLSPVGDWTTTTRDGVAIPRTHTAVHEATAVGPNLLSYDVQGNLTRDEHSTGLAWDPENRLQRAVITPDASTTGFGAIATYRYDALGRRIAKTVQNRTTLYLPAGAQTVVELEHTAIPTQAQIDGSEADGTLANAALSPASGGILPGVVTRISFQPATTATPAGFLRDTGTISAVRTNGLTYGWSTDATSQAVTRHGAVDLTEFDTFVQAQPDAGGSSTWSIALPNGSYPVIVVAGDALSTDQTNHLVIGTTTVTDATPAAAPAYEAGNFDGYAVQATVTNGILSIAPATGAFHAKLCFVEIGQAGATISQATVDRLAALIAQANAQTGASPEPVEQTKEFVYGSYVDEVVAYRQTVGTVVSTYYLHYNHLYSVAALTNAAGAVVERYAYDAYGKQTITAPVGGVVRAKSAVGWDRGFTGYVTDNETGLTYARARMYSLTLGRFIGRDRNFLTMQPRSHNGYADGYSLYRAHMVPNKLDPTGLETVHGTIGSPNNLHWEYDLEVTKKCENGTPTISVTGPKNLNALYTPDSTGFSIAIVGVTWEATAELETKSEPGTDKDEIPCPCPPYPKGSKTKTQIVYARVLAYWHITAGANPGLGPWSWDIGLSFDIDDTEKESGDWHTFTKSCCPKEND